MRRALLSLTAAAFVLLLTSCGDPTSPANDPAGTVPAGSPSSTAPPSTLPPNTVTPAPPAGSSPAAGRQITVEGVVESGVEPGCKVLRTATGEYLILGGAPVPLGVPVKVTGIPQVGVSTTCQQGTPLRVVTVQRR